MIYVDDARCTGCGQCLTVCDHGALALHDGVARIATERCAQCGACLSACPAGAICELLERPLPAAAPPAHIPAARALTTPRTLLASTALKKVATHLAPALLQAALAIVDHYRSRSGRRSASCGKRGGRQRARLSRVRHGRQRQMRAGMTPQPGSRSEPTDR